ncbi:MAG: hypothetical protein Q8R63_04820 [Ramlibacter sp.]|nr:hypothetical protein [Ramlibacter sp.]
MNADQTRDKAKGETIPVQGETQDPVPRMPHERDESSSSQESAEPTAKAVGKAALADVERGVVDTSRATETDRAYTQVRKSTDTPDKQFRP